MKLAISFKDIKIPVSKVRGSFLMVALFFASPDVRGDGPRVMPEMVGSPRSLYLTITQGPPARSLALQKAEGAANIAQRDLDQAGYQSWPQVELQGFVARTVPETSRDGALSAQLNYKIYDFGRTAAREKTLVFERDLKSLQKDLQVEAFTWELARKILAVQTAHNLFEIQGAILETSAVKQKIVQDNVKKGLRPLYELKLAELERHNHKLALTKAQAEWERSWVDFKMFLDQWFPAPWVQEIHGATQKILAQNKNTTARREGTQSLPQTGSAVALGPQVFFSQISPPESWLKQAQSWQRGPVDLDSKIRDTAKAKGQSELEVYRADKSPEVFLNLEATYGGTWDAQSPSYSGRLGLRWLLPWHGQSQLEQEKNQEKIQLAETEYSLTQQKRAQEYELGLADLRNLAQTWQAQDALYRARLELQRLTQERQQAGKATVYELAQTELELTSLIVEKVKTAHRAQEVALRVAQSLNLKNPEIVLNNQWSSHPL